MIRSGGVRQCVTPLLDLVELIGEINKSLFLFRVDKRGYGAAQVGICVRREILVQIERKVL